MLLSNSAEQFVQFLGFGMAKGLLKLSDGDRINCGNGFIQFDVSISDLKHLVESYELVERFGGLHRSHEILGAWAFMLSVKAKVGKSADLLAEDYRNLKKAIVDVESCQ